MHLPKVTCALGSSRGAHLEDVKLGTAFSRTNTVDAKKTWHPFPIKINYINVGVIYIYTIHGSYAFLTHSKKYFPQNDLLNNTICTSMDDKLISNVWFLHPWGHPWGQRVGHQHPTLEWVARAPKRSLVENSQNCRDWGFTKFGMLNQK